LRRFRAEAEILAQLQHANVVQIFEVGEHQGLPFFAMEFVAGSTLQKLVQKNPLDPARAARLTHLLAGAMQSAHQRGIIHRDLKPANVLLAADEVPKVTDFGLARQGKSEMTASGAVLGTPSYMAPQQALGQLDRIGPATDVYALGAILFELLTGRAPFRAATITATLQQVVHDEPVPPRLQPGVPRDLDTICLKCLEKQPARRYPSAQALEDDLHRFLKGEPILARPIGWLERLARWARREPKVAALSAALLVGATASFLALASLWQAERSARLQVVHESQLKEEQLYFHRIWQADRELETPQRLHWAEDALSRCPEPLREWEWRHLAHRCKHGAPACIPAPGTVGCLATHRERPVAVVGCHNGTIALLEDGRFQRQPLHSHLGSVNWVVFGTGGGEFLSGGEDGEIHAWQFPDLRKVMTFSGHTGPISCIAVHSSEPWVASTAFAGDESGTVLVWDRHTGKRIHTLKNHSRRVTGLAFHPGGELLASASHDHTITLWDCRKGEVVRVLNDHHAPIACVAFSRDGELLASSAGVAQSDRPQANEIYLWDVGGTVRHRLFSHGQRAITLAFSPTGKRLVTAGWDRQAKLWDVNTGQEVLTLRTGHQDGIIAVAFDSREALYTGSYDGLVSIWETAAK
jgi:hypothetical protein